MLRFLKQIELYVAGAAFLLMLGVITLNVFARYLFSTSILSAEELAYFGFIWSVFAAVSWLYRERTLIVVDVFFSTLPRALQWVVAALVDLMLVAANIWFCRLAWTLAAGGWVRKTPVLHIPYFWVDLAPVLAFALMALYSVGHLVEDLRLRRPVASSVSNDDDLYKDSAL